MPRQHAVVLGAGIAGLLAARVLSESFERVTVVERDRLPGDPVSRRGVPQGRHVHSFQARGVQVADQLFPGLTRELAAAGASVVGDLAELHLRVDGHLLNQGPKPITAFMLGTRPFVEHAIRGRVAGIPTVTIRDGLEVRGLLSTGAPGRTVVHGVRVGEAGGGADEDLAADLVVDATGRGSRTPAWLTGFGYQRPVEERIAVRVTYVSQTLRIPEGAVVPPFIVEGRSAQLDLGVTFLACEQRTWVFSVAGASRAFPDRPTREWMQQVAEECLLPSLWELVRRAEPLTPVSAQQHPASIRRRYDKLTRFPAGLLVMGDALCSFNPVYGQGMSVVFEQALALQGALQGALRGAPAGGDRRLFARFFTAAAKPTLNAWQLAAGPDLADPDTPGSASLWARLTGRYAGRVFRIAEQDPEVARRYMAVVGLVAPSRSLFRARVLLPVLGSIPETVLRILGSG